MKKIQSVCFLNFKMLSNPDFLTKLYLLRILYFTCLPLTKRDLLTARMRGTTVPTIQRMRRILKTREECFRTAVVVTTRRRVHVVRKKVNEYNVNIDVQLWNQLAMKIIDNIW